MEMKSVARRIERCEGLVHEILRTNVASPEVTRGLQELDFARQEIQDYASVLSIFSNAVKYGKDVEIDLVMSALILEHSKLNFSSHAGISNSTDEKKDEPSHATLFSSDFI